MLVKCARRSGMKEFWDNQGWSQEAHDLEQYTNYFFLISQSSLADKAPVIVTVSPTGVEQSQRRAGWEAAQADRNRPHAHCAAPYYKDPSLLTSISFLGNISLSKQRHRNHASKECYVCIFCRHLDCWTKSDTSGMRPLEPLAAPAQARARAHQESCRTEDVTSAGEDKLTPM